MGDVNNGGIEAQVKALAASCEAIMLEAEGKGDGFSLEDIGLALANQKGRAEKAEERLVREKDARAGLVADETAYLQAKCDDLQKAFDELKVASDEGLSSSVKALRELQVELGKTRTDLEAVRENLADNTKAACIVLEAILQRPHRFMEVYGQDVYQAAKDTFCNLGGESDKLPHPEVNRMMEDMQKQGELDAD